MINLFKWGSFVGAGGGKLDWKIECEALTEEDWHCIACLAVSHFDRRGTNISHVLPVPRGGAPLALEITKYFLPTPPLTHPLIVDDVWTTGKSMRDVAKPFKTWKGFVAFARGPLPPNVKCFMQVMV